jgi:ribosome biogenesis GTPase A/uncharacterized protein YoxC
MKAILDTESAQLLSSVGGTLQQLKALTSEIQHAQLEATVEAMLAQLETPFTFVIVGEVKAGKSSFINALLDTDKEICKVAPSPMTDTIQLITYGSEEKIIDINPYLKRIEQPVEILKEIAIVDTPGTNTIVDHHQEITERFIPHSDLIVFVFEAKNPYRQSSWEFFDYINEEWRRKIIFVLQQKDLLPDNDLQTNIGGVTEQAIKKGIDNPTVFDVSAKQEIEGLKEESGFKAIRSFITQHITGGKAPVLKAQNNTETARTIVEKIQHSLDLRRRQWEADQSFRSAIKVTLEEQTGKTAYQIDMLVENLVATYDRISGETYDKLGDGMAFVSVMKRSVSSVFGSTESLKSWLSNEAKDFEHKLNSALRNKLQQGIVDVADNIQTMAKLVHGQLKDSKMILSDSDEIFADIAERRANVLKELQESFASFMQDSENFYDEQLVKDSGNVAPNMAAGSGLAIVGVILATITNGAVFDITGGILTTIGVLFAGVSLGLKRKKILRGFRDEIKRGRERITFEVKERLTTYTERIGQRIDDNFFQLDRLLDHEAKTLDKFEGQQDNIRINLDEHLQETKRLLE